MTKNSLLLAACIASQIGFAVPVVAQNRDLLAGTPSELGALPSRARKSAAPAINQPLKLEAVRNESHPALRGSFIVGEDVLRLVGAGFGTDAGGREVQMSVLNAKIALRILSWRDDEIRVQVPDLIGLGIDGKVASELNRELSQTKKRVVGPDVEVGIALESRWVAKRGAQLAVAYRDLDGDGSRTRDDCDDFDPRRSPDHKEVYDPQGLDEDCNEATQAAPPTLPTPPSDVLNVDDPLEL